MGKIFVNYRRDDAGAAAARLRDRLATVYGATKIFMDVDNLRPGQRFDLELSKALSECDVFLSVIGARWYELLYTRAQGGGHDYVREEIGAALAQDILIIPILIDRAPLPGADALPDDLRPLVFHQKHDITHEHFGRDVDALIAIMAKEKKSLRPNWGHRNGGLTRRRVVGGALVGATAIGAATFGLRDQGGPTQEWHIGSSNGIHDFQFLSSARLALTAIARGSVEIIDPWTKRIAHVYAGHKDDAFCVGMPADERTIVSGSNDQTVRVWDSSSIVEKYLLEGHTSGVGSVAVARDGTYCLSSAGWELKLWDLQRGHLIRDLESPRNGVGKIRLLPGDRLVISTCGDGTLKIWDVATGRIARSLSGHIGNALDVVVSADGRFAVSGGTDSTVRKWDLSTGQAIWSVSGLPDRVLKVMLTPDDSKVIAGIATDLINPKKNEIKFFDAENGRELQTLYALDHGTRAMSVSSDGQWLLAGGSTGVIRLWSIAGI